MLAVPFYIIDTTKVTLNKNNVGAHVLKGIIDVYEH